VIVPELVELPAGEFWMGGVSEDKFVTDVERPRHLVRIGSKVSLGRFPVTQQQFSSSGGDFPVVGVSWQEARNFAEWVGAQVGGEGRLPTEGEWEYAARSGCENSAMPGVDEANYLYQEDGEKVGVGELTKVGQYPLNPFGYGDLLGNVLEWVEDDWRPNYWGSAGDGSALRDGGARRVVRGGAWDSLPRLLRVTWRDGLPCARRQDNLGFRVAVKFPER